MFIHEPNEYCSTNKHIFPHHWSWLANISKVHDYNQQSKSVHIISMNVPVKTSMEVEKPQSQYNFKQLWQRKACMSSQGAHCSGECGKELFVYWHRLCDRHTLKQKNIHTKLARLQQAKNKFESDKQINKPSRHKQKKHFTIASFASFSAVSTLYSSAIVFPPFRSCNKIKNPKIG